MISRLKGKIRNVRDTTFVADSWLDSKAVLSYLWTLEREEYGIMPSYSS